MLSLNQLCEKNGMTMDDLITQAEKSMFSLDDPGYCMACGTEVFGVEPDARGYQCEVCDENAVYGLQEIMMCG